MTVSRRDAIVAGAAALPASTLLLAAVQAQVTTTRPGDPGPTTPPAPTPPGEDGNLAACMLLKGRRQIETCTFAKGRSQNEEVRNFLQAEIDEHTAIKAALTKLGFAYPAPPAPPAAPPLVVPPDTSGLPPDSTRAPVAPAPTAAVVALTVGTAPVVGQAAQMLKVDSEVIEQCVANYKAKMPTKQGLKFEKAVVGDQLHEHEALKDRVQVFIPHASAQMKPTLQQGLATIEKHIAALGAIMDKLDAQKG